MSRAPNFARLLDSCNASGTPGGGGGGNRKRRGSPERERRENSAKRTKSGLPKSGGIESFFRPTSAPNAPNVPNVPNVPVPSVKPCVPVASSALSASSPAGEPKVVSEANSQSGGRPGEQASSRRTNNADSANSVDSEHDDAAVSGKRTSDGGDIVRNDQYGTRNEHERDKFVFMVESTHLYCVCVTRRVDETERASLRGVAPLTRFSSRYMISGTTILGRYFSEFDAMKQSCRIARIPDGKMKRKWGSSEMVLAKKAEYDGLTAEQIRNGWAVNGKVESFLGTRMHNSLERFYHGLPIDDEVKQSHEYAMFLDFHENEVKRRGWEMYHAEWMVWEAERLFVAGSMDAPFFVRDAQGKINMIIGDWKRTKEIDAEAFQGKTGSGPFSMVPGNKLGKYGAQGNLYAWLVEHIYGIKCTDVYVICFHPSQSAYKLRKAPDYRHEIDELMKLRAAEVVELKREYSRACVLAESLVGKARTIVVCGDVDYEDSGREIDAVVGRVHADASLRLCGDAGSRVDERVCALRAIGTNGDGGTKRTSKHPIRTFPSARVSHPEEFARLEARFGHPHFIEEVLGVDALAERTNRILDGSELVVAFHDSVYTCKNTSSIIKEARSRSPPIPVHLVGFE